MRKELIDTIDIHRRFFINHSLGHHSLSPTDQLIIINSFVEFFGNKFLFSRHVLDGQKYVFHIYFCGGKKSSSFLMLNY